MTYTITDNTRIDSGAYIVPSGISRMHISSNGAMAIGSQPSLSRDSINHMLVSMADLDSDVFNAKVETLVDLWLARYGNNWVDIDEVERDKTFVLIYKRLRSMGKLEVHFLTDRAKFVCRKPE